MPLWLVGMMGSGKTAVGKELAAHIGSRFADTDQLIEIKAGMRIKKIWEAEGEEGFRAREKEVLRSIEHEEDVIVATGGGVVLDPTNIELMRSGGTVVWLDARPATLATRIGNSGHRPLLAGQDLASRLFEISNQRRAAYQAAAHHRVVTEGRSVDEVADEVEELWTRS